MWESILPCLPWERERWWGSFARFLLLLVNQIFNNNNKKQHRSNHLIVLLALRSYPFKFIYLLEWRSYLINSIYKSNVGAFEVIVSPCIYIANRVLPSFLLYCDFVCNTRESSSQRKKCLRVTNTHAYTFSSELKKKKKKPTVLDSDQHRLFSWFVAIGPVINSIQVVVVVVVVVDSGGIYQRLASPPRWTRTKRYIQVLNFTFLFSFIKNTHTQT